MQPGGSRSSYEKRRRAGKSSTITRHEDTGGWAGQIIQAHCTDIVEGSAMDGNAPATKADLDDLNSDVIALEERLTEVIRDAQAELF